ncbi:MAG: hypothetical protein WKH64_01710 [Chloroflexia bacterium]
MPSTDATGPSSAQRARRLGMSLPLLVLGLFIFSLGIVFTLHSSLGLGPWDVLHQGSAGASASPSARRAYWSAGC